jgi:hypothetical protein
MTSTSLPVAQGNWSVDDTGEHVTVVRADLPAVADVRAFEVRLTETDLRTMLAELRARQLGLDADRTGGL